MAQPDAGVVVVATAGAWLAGAWLMLVAALAVVSRLHGPVARAATGLLLRLTPAAVHGVLGVGVGVALVAAPAGAAADEHRWPRLDRAVAPFYVVRPGDCLWSIAERDLARRARAAGAAAVAEAWPRWYATNREVVGPDPNLIRPGQRLRAPAPR